MHLSTYVGLLHSSEQALADSYRQVAEGHAAEVDVFHMCQTLAAMCDGHVRRLAPIVERYGEEREAEPERLHADVLESTREGPVGMLRDLQDLYLLASLVDTSWTVVEQAAQGVRDRELMGLALECTKDIHRQLSWLTTHLKAAAPQALIAA
jgi:hypothetical protein